MTSSTPLAELSRASFGYEGRAILRDVSFAVNAGDFWGILGANGSGKTTMMRSILGLLPHIHGKVVSQSRSGGSARFGYVPQKERLDAIYPLSGSDVAAMGAWRKLDLLERFTPGGGSRRFVDKCLASCGATGFARLPFSALSGGQKQRVLIARALAAEPEILVLDEPLSGIDAPTQKGVLELLAQLKKERDLTILMVSHRIREEKALFTHIAWVDGGRVTTGTTGAMLKQGALAEAFRGEI